jgi:hypothetical protein
MGAGLPLVYVLALAVSPPAVKEPGYTRLPWHLVDVDLDFGEQRAVQTVEVDYQLFDPAPDQGHGLFLVPLNGTLCGKLTYAGALSSGFMTGEYVTGGKNLSFTIAKPGYVFTQFGTNAADAVVPVRGGEYYLSDHEGPLASVRREATYAKGLYTLRLAARPPDPGAKGDRPRTVVDLTVTRHADGSEAKVGGLAFDAAEFTFGPHVSSFSEVTQGWDAEAKRWRKAADNGAADIPCIRYAVGNWRLDGKPVTAKQAVAYYPADVPQRARVYPLKDCPDKELKAAADKALAGGDTLVYVVSKEEHRRTGDTVQQREFEGVGGRKYDAVREVLKKGDAADKPPPAPTDKPPPGPKDKPSTPKTDGSGEAKPVPPGSNGGDAKPYM